MHILLSDETFHHYLGDPVELLQLHPASTATTHILGPDLLAGHRPQLTVPRDTWQGSRLFPPPQGNKVAAPMHGFALLGCTVAPGFDYADYRSGNRADLLARWPAQAELTRALTHHRD